MRSRLFLVTFLSLFGALTFYVGFRGWQWVSAVTPLNPWAYWLPYSFVASAFLLNRLTARTTPAWAGTLLATVGVYWMPVFLYGLLALVLLEIVALLNALLGLVPPSPELTRTVGSLVLLAVTATVLYGIWRARRPVAVRYDIAIAKTGGKHRDLHIVLVSDTHLGEVDGERRLRQMVAMVGDLNPDLVLLAGDLLDDSLGPFVARNMPAELARLKPPLGAYAVLGNHDHLAGRLDEYREHLQRANIQLLVDEWVKVDDSLYIIGRDDHAGRYYRGRDRLPLTELLQGMDRSLPLIVMDHQPRNLDEAERAGIDLQVSGHTHRGQMFPFHLVTRRIFELDWGYLRKGTLHVIVSLGFGTWGPPVRVGNRPELVSIRVRFGS